ncbi:MAG: hypothetical protein ABIH72_05725 [archaeon]
MFFNDFDNKDYEYVGDGDFNRRVYHEWDSLQVRALEKRGINKVPFDRVYVHAMVNKALPPRGCVSDEQYFKILDLLREKKCIDEGKKVDMEQLDLLMCDLFLGELIQDIENEPLRDTTLEVLSLR